MSKEIISKMESNYNLILDARKEIAQLKKNKAISRSASWADAQGTAKEKEDYVKAAVAEIDVKIKVKEAEIEHMYNMVHLWNEELMMEDE